MVKKLISSLGSQTKWRLLSKAFLSAVVLFLADSLSFSFFAVLGFLFIMLWVYLSEGSLRSEFKFSFWLNQIVFLLALQDLSLIGGSSLFSVYLPVLFLAVYGIIMFFLLGLMNSVFPNKLFVYSLTSTVSIFSFFSVLFYRMPSFYEVTFLGELFWFLIDFLVVFYMFREFSGVTDFVTGKKMRAFGLSLGVILSEISALVVLLPLGFLNAAAFLSLLFLIIRDVIFAKENGFLNMSFVFREVTIFIVISSVIFATVKWYI